ncbi:uncharacterized protein LAESUDRAFT_813283 [Laetiporus sulphureus 93-53]|uniref:Uncharacterized protein n=1 Tax=Laetiporus sulphureus 93-53 TaxID=1314785 RepID=A0A165DW23_9APHY|nr:uncharacterized protein LAESUDRAFT_813283 [Laetiporus sulphureus 93-53]KZT05744.1 hypothetical protein LAESUDRAFT_813283 [Laetiporus sulphureus 93-53]
MCLTPATFFPSSTISTSPAGTLMSIRNMAFPFKLNVTVNVSNVHNTTVTQARTPAGQSSSTHPTTTKTSDSVKKAASTPRAKKPTAVKGSVPVKAASSQAKRPAGAKTPAANEAAKGAAKSKH